MIRHGFLQAGGGSTRFGTDKALAKFAGKTMLQRTGELLESVSDDVHIVGSRGKYEDTRWPLIPDRWPGEGPLGGVLTALRHIEELDGARDQSFSWALILSCDMPFLTREFLGFLWERAADTHAHVVVPQSENGLEPLCACWRVEATEVVQAAFGEGIRKVTQAMKRLSMEVLDESAWKRFDSGNRLFWNMNTPGDYEEARRILEAGNR
jgi:molybdenum cofactor guanylyltransferase